MKMSEDTKDGLVILLGIIMCILFAYAICAPLHEVGWVKWPFGW
jgi:hypothetical protein